MENLWSNHGLSFWIFFNNFYRKIVDLRRTRTRIFTVKDARANQQTNTTGHGRPNNENLAPISVFHFEEKGWLESRETFPSSSSSQDRDILYFTEMTAAAPV